MSSADILVKQGLLFTPLLTWITIAEKGNIMMRKECHILHE
jgi:hypothetical protein